jgi:type IV fimbrial biogenesis protein FimT
MNTSYVIFPVHRLGHLRRQGARGFTAIEMLVVIALLGILLALAVPSFSGTLKRHRISTAAASVSNALQFARVEAIRTRSQVTLQKTATPPQDCTDSGQAADWSCGLDVYVDANRNNVQDANEPVLKTIHATAFNGLNVQFEAGSLAFGSLGAPVTSTGPVHVWPESPATDTAQTSSHTRTVCIGLSGKVWVIPSYVPNCS